MDCVRHFVLFYEPFELEKLKVSPASIIGYAVLTAGLLRLRFDSIGQGFDFGYFGICILICLYIHLVVGSQYTSVKEMFGNSKEGKNSVGSGSLQFVSVAALFLSFCYALAGPILGIQHMGAPTMYSNMRYYFGGNHLLVPTSILPEDIIYGGSLVQVVKSTCITLNYRLAYIPSEDVFPPTALKYYETALSKQDVYQLFPLCISNPHSFEVLRSEYEKANPKGSETFASFILPISEVRKSLAEARSASDSYSVTLTEDSAGCYVVLNSDGSCVVTTPDGEPLEETCEDNRLAQAMLSLTEPLEPLFGSQRLAEVIRGLREKLLTPYPQLAGWNEEMCMS